ncbi:MAG: hypothetical protein AAF639_33915 [Chloroflexota bacterium]
MEQDTLQNIAQEGEGKMSRLRDVGIAVLLLGVMLGLMQGLVSVLISAPEPEPMITKFRAWILALNPEVQTLTILLLILMIALGVRRLLFGRQPLLIKKITSSQGQSTRSSIPSRMPYAQSTVQRLTSLYPPTIEPHLRDAIAVDFEEACAEAIDAGNFRQVYRFELWQLRYEVAYAWWAYYSERVKRWIA